MRCLHVKQNLRGLFDKIAVKSKLFANLRESKSKLIFFFILADCFVSSPSQQYVCLQYLAKYRKEMFYVRVNM